MLSITLLFTAEQGGSGSEVFDVFGGVMVMKNTQTIRSRRIR
jgi:hypothetical protein